MTHKYNIFFLLFICKYTIDIVYLHRVNTKYSINKKKCKA